jgi:hypothetical protein
VGTCFISCRNRAYCLIYGEGQQTRKSANWLTRLAFLGLFSVICGRVALFGDVSAFPVGLDKSITSSLLRSIENIAFEKAVLLTFIMNGRSLRNLSLR